MICLNCKYWSISEYVDMGICSLSEQNQKYIYISSEDRHPTDMFTDKNFGCNQWDKKEESKIIEGEIAPTETQ